MKLGFIGYGKSVHRYHGPFVKMIDELEVIGYYSRGTRQFEMPFPPFENLKSFDSCEQLLESDVDIIAVCSASATHYEFAKQALLAGKHVIVEKPLCNTLEEAKELYRLANERGLKLAPYQNRRYDSDFLDIKKAIFEFGIGDIIDIESNHTQFRPDGKDYKGTIYDGMVYGHAVHFVDQIVSLLGEPDDIVYDVGNIKGKLLNGSSDVDDYYNIIMNYGTMRVRVNYNPLVVKDGYRFIVNGLNASVQKYGIDQQERDLKLGIYPDAEEFGTDLPEMITKVYYLDKSEAECIAPKQYYSQYYQDFIDCIVNKANIPVTENEALVVINILETIATRSKFKKLNITNM